MNLESHLFTFLRFAFRRKSFWEVARGLIRKTRMNFSFPRDRCGQPEREFVVPCCRVLPRALADDLARVMLVGVDVEVRR